MRFIDNNDGTIIDTETNLMWQKNYIPDKLNLIEAIKYAKNFNLGGHIDWRLPTSDELITIVRYKFENPVIASNFSITFFYCQGKFLTSSMHSFIDNHAEVIDFDINKKIIYYKNIKNCYFARYVRANNSSNVCDELKKPTNNNILINKKESLIDIFQKEFRQNK